MAENVTRLSKAEIRAANASLSRVLFSGLVSGGLVFSIVLVAYFSVLFGQGTLVRLELHPLFKVFRAADGRIYGTKSTMENIHSRYQGLGSFAWINYEYTGRMMLTDARGGVGVIFLARRRERKDCHYSLRRCGQEDTFFVTGCGMEPEVAGRTDTEFSPKARVWHRFKVQVQDAGKRTQIRAKVWKDGIAEPAQWQVECFDTGPARNCKGSVGVWACSEGKKYFDDLLVKPMSAQPRVGSPEIMVVPDTKSDASLPPEAGAAPRNNARSHQYLLRENFDRFSVGTHPAEWKDETSLDLSEAADRISRFFRMNLLDFSGPWDEVVDWATIALTFCLAGLFAGIVRRRRICHRESKASIGWKCRIPFEFLPFVALFIYDGARKGAIIVLYAAAGLCAGYLWRFLHALLLARFPCVGVGPSVPYSPQKTRRQRASAGKNDC